MTLDSADEDDGTSALVGHSRPVRIIAAIEDSGVISRILEPLEEREMHARRPRARGRLASPTDHG